MVRLDPQAGSQKERGCFAAWLYLSHMIPWMLFTSLCTSAEFSISQESCNHGNCQDAEFSGLLGLQEFSP